MKHAHLLIIFLITSCASAPILQELTYEDGQETKIENRIILDEDFDLVWNRLVGNLSKTFYVINNIDKESRLINVSFNLNDKLSDYVDCGKSSRSFQLGDLRQDITYKVADSSNYFSESNVSPNPNITYLKVYRDTSLEGRANIFVAPESGKTTVMINNRYVVSVKTSFDTLLYAVLYKRHMEQNQFGRRLLNPQPDPISFNTNTTSNADIKCSSTGKFETDILKLARS
tara:strand:- start:156 stop:842 length:687 start_codon:yes stop_codon:yes gene_type:complete